MEIGCKIKQLRIKHSISQKQLSSEVLGLSQAYLSQLEAGKKSITVNKLKDICDYFGITLVEFFADEEDQDGFLIFLLNKIKKLNKKERETINNLLDFLLDKKVN